MTMSGSAHTESPKKALMGLFILGLLGGLLLEAGDKFLRFWARDIGFGPDRLDILNGIELLQPLRFLWMPLLAASIRIGPWQQRRLWIMIMLLICLVCIGVMRSQVFLGGVFLSFLTLLTIGRTSFDALVIAAQMQGVERRLWGWSENMCVSGYRFGMAIIMSCGLRASAFGWTWPQIYLGILALGAIGLVWVARSPNIRFLDQPIPNPEQIGVKKVLTQWLRLPGSWWVLALLLLYRAQDGLIAFQHDIFWMSHGLSKIALSNIKIPAIIASTLGGVLASLIIRRRGYHTALLFGLFVHALVAWIDWAVSLGWIQDHRILPFLYIITPLTTGLAMVAIYSFQLICCRGPHAITQIALWAALTDLGMRLFSLRSGWVVVHLGWPWLMALGGIMCLPISWVIRQAFRHSFVGENDTPPLST